jgi:hypothetical protein
MPDLLDLPVVSNFGQTAPRRSPKMSQIPSREVVDSFLSLNEQHGGAGIDCRRRDVIQSLHYGWRKIERSSPAGHAVIEDVEDSLVQSRIVSDA